MTALVAELVDTVRVQDGRLFVRQEPVDLNAVAADAVATARLLTQEQTVVLEGTAEPLVVIGDAVRLEQVLIGQVSNAIAYAPGTDRILVRLGRAEGLATVEVGDTGGGIPPADLDRIFVRYYRAPGAENAAPSGLGLGLFRARELLAAQRGTIEVRSTLGEGTTFTVRLPLLSDAEATPERDTPSPAAAAATG